MTYTLKNITSGEEKTLDEWGVDEHSPQIRLENLSPDSFTFQTQETFDATPQFAKGTRLALYRTDDAGAKTQVFYGRVDRIKRVGNGETEALSYLVVGPWHWLERTIFVATWNILVNPLDPSAGTVPFENSHVVLLLHTNGTKLKTASQIATLMNYAIDASEESDGEPAFQYDATGCPDIDMPFDEVRDMSPAECVRRLIRLVPNCTSWFDYSTSPPTLHLKQRPALTEKNLTAAVIDQVELDERHDLVTSGVIITYETTNRTSGAANTVLSRRAYPAEASAKHLNPIAASVNLEGASITEVTATFETEAPPTSQTKKEWWKARETTIAQENVTELTIGDTTRTTDVSQYPYVVKPGQNVPAWAAETAEDEFKTTASYHVIKDAETVRDKVVDEPLSQRVTVSKKPGGTYRTITEIILAEPEPVGLEQAIYEAMSQLHYDGTIVASDESGEVDFSTTLGHVINITGMRAEWETMKAQVQSITHVLSTGQTTIQVGPPRHLGVDDIIELLRVTRFRMRWTQTAVITSGQGTATGVALNGKTGKDNTQKGRGTLEKFTVGDLITLDKAAAFGKTITLRELRYCDNGTERYVLVLASELYDTSVAAQ